MIWPLQILVAVLFIFLAGFFSGTETGIYRLSRLHLRVGIEQKRRFFALLGRTMHDTHSLVLSTLLGTNLSQYIVTGIVTFMLLGAAQSKHAAALYATGLMAPVLFIFSELIPKNIYFYRADALLPRLAPVLWAFDRLFTWCGIVPLLKLISRGFGRATETTITAGPQHYIGQIIKETREEGFLTPIQSEIMDRLVNVQNTHLSQVYVPISTVQTADIATDRVGLLNILKQASFSRLPVCKDDRDNIVGFIDIYEALASREMFNDLSRFVRAIAGFSADTGVIDALNRMREQGNRIALVTQARRHGQPRVLGIVTVKDLVEELTGELAEW